MPFVPSRGSLPLTATSPRPDFAQSMGFRGCKIPLPYGPCDGAEGMRRNIEHLKRVRSVVGPEFPLILDCFMSLTVPYAVELVRRIASDVRGGVAWLEEPFLPHAYESFAELREKVGHLIQLCSGEHEYSLHGFKQLLERKCVDIIQPDVARVGGITETRRIIALARAADIPVCVHGGGNYSLHVQFAFTNCHFGSVMLDSPTAVYLPQFGGLFLGEPVPASNGYISLPHAPGFGLTLNREVGLIRPYQRTPASFEDIEAVKNARSIPPSTYIRLAESIPLGSPPPPDPRSFEQ